MKEALFLIACGDCALGETVQDFLQERGQSDGSPVHCDIVLTEKGALNNLKLPDRTYDLFLLTPDLHPGGSQTADPHWRGMDLLSRLRREGSALPFVVLAETLSNELNRRAAALQPCVVLGLSGEAWEEDLAATCHNLRAASTPSASAAPKPREVIKVDIYLGAERENNSFVITGKHFDGIVRPLVVDTGELELLQPVSDNIQGLLHDEDVEAWQKQLHYIGRRLRDQFRSGEKSLLCDLFKRIANEAGDESIKIRFVVGKSLHSLVLEALLYSEEDYWILHSPVYRTVYTGTEIPEASASPLFKDEATRQGQEPINWLLIEANCEGDVPTEQREQFRVAKFPTLSLLPDLEQEIEELNAFLAQAKSNNAAGVRINQVQRLRLPEGGKAPEESLTEVLQAGSWHVVHFAGHSYYDRATGRGFVFLPRGQTRSPVPVPDKQFARLLRVANTRLAYMNSCDSSNAGFAFEMAGNLVPAVVGFRWKIDDSPARRHACVFYQELFREKERGLEYAFLKTRQQMRIEFSHNHIWAASMLILNQKA